MTADLVMKHVIDLLEDIQAPHPPHHSHSVGMLIVDAAKDPSGFQTAIDECTAIAAWYSQQPAETQANNAEVAIIETEETPHEDNS